MKYTLNKDEYSQIWKILEVIESSNKDKGVDQNSSWKNVVGIEPLASKIKEAILKGVHEVTIDDKIIKADPDNIEVDILKTELKSFFKGIVSIIENKPIKFGDIQLFKWVAKILQISTAFEGYLKSVIDNIGEIETDEDTIELD